METITIVVLAAGASITFVFFFAFGLLSLREREPRAARLSFLIGILLTAPLASSALLPVQIRTMLVVLLTALFTIILLLFLWPAQRIEVDTSIRSTRFDERDVVFARKRLIPDSPDYDAYYAMRPENLAFDTKIRTLPGLMSPRARYFDPLVIPAAAASFECTTAIREAVDGPVAADPTQRSAEDLSNFVKGLAKHLGASAVGITELDRTHVYSHIGRGSGTYGAPIDLDHRFAIAFTVEMSHAIMGCAPQAPVVMESAIKYVEFAVIAIQLANWIRRQGYPARAHIDGNYRVIAPLVARDAGLGEIGRIGILMTPKLGPRVRVGVVTTDLPLIPDPRKHDPTVLDFCRLCLKCAENCPSKAIPFGEREESGGGLRWKLNEQKCYHYWNVIGTDCGLCMTVCPYSHPDNWGHSIVRSLIRRSRFARHAALRLDDVFYARRPTPRSGPEWLA